MAQAQRTGALAAFNAEYRRRRIAAFITYGKAQARLRKALGKVAAAGLRRGRPRACSTAD
jgi:hypothetical protein